MSGLADETRWLDAVEQADLVRRREVSAVELLEAAVTRIEAIDPVLNAVVIRWFDEAERTAAALDAATDEATSAATADGTRPPLAGVPLLLKDLWTSYAGQPLTNGNRALKAALPVSAQDTTLVARLRAAGLVIAGRTNSPELGNLPTTEPEAWGPTRNPWALDRTPGGSSGGAAAAVAAGLVSLAQASDGGGSIRIPASCCGLVGLKPSQGRITLGPGRDESNLGVELAVSRSVRDTAVLLDAVHGPGVGDVIIAPAPTGPYADEVQAEPKRLRIGLLDHHPHGEHLHQDCVAAVRAAAHLLESLGHDVEESYPAALADPRTGRRFAVLWATNASVGVTQIGRQLGRPVTPDDVEGLTWAMAELARTMSASDHARALAAAVRHRRAVQQWWADGFDLLLTPTVGEPPPRLGRFVDDPTDPLQPLERSGLLAAFTGAFNVSGQPAISLPLHWTVEGLPVGIQLVAAYGREDLLLRVAGQLERAQPWAHRRPPV